jgi:glycosyltransferase involved in cell wall biosynthesis
MQKENDPYTYVDTKSLSEFMPYQWEKDITIFVACYNEEDNIIGTFDTLVSSLFKTDLTWEIIVIDDASNDKSKELICHYIEDHPNYDIKLIARKKNTGLAQNYIDGAFMAKGKYYKLVCGDNNDNVPSLVKIFSFIGKADMIMPYYFKSPGKSTFRVLLSKTYTFIVNLISGYNIKYYNGCGLNLTWNIMRWHTNHLGFCFQADIATRLLDLGMSYIEIPVTVEERKNGVSTALKFMNFLSVSHFLFELWLRRLGKARFIKRLR